MCEWGIRVHYILDSAQLLHFFFAFNTNAGVMILNTHFMLCVTNTHFGEVNVNNEWHIYTSNSGRQQNNNS